MFVALAVTMKWAHGKASNVYAGAGFRDSIPLRGFEKWYAPLRFTFRQITMTEFEHNRRSFLVGLSGLGVSQALAQELPKAESAPHRYVLASSEGEHLIHFRDRGNIFIKLGSATGSDNLALGTQQVTVGAGIPIHRHLHMDEAFYVLEGGGSFTLNEESHPFERGATIFIPRNFWHSFANPDHELRLLWITSPAGLDGFFRETCSPPGAPPKQFTGGQIKTIALKYGTEFR